MIEINDDETAFRILTEAKQATGDEREQMADAVIAYGEKKAKQEYNDADKHFSKLFTDQAYFEQEKAANVAVQESIDPDQTAKSAAIGAWLEHRTGRPVDTMSYQVERDAFAMANYGQKNLDDAQFFDFVSGEYETQQKKTEALNDLHMQSVGKAIKDAQLGQNRPFVDGMTEVFNQWQQKYPELVDGTNDAAFLSQGYKLYYDTFNDLDSVRPQAAQTLSTLEKFTKGESDPESLQTLSNTLIGATPEERQKIYKYVTLAAEAGHIDRAGLDQFALNMGQAFTRGFDFVPQGSLQMQEAGVNNWLESIRNGTQIWVPADGNLSKAEVGNAPAGVESDAWRQATLPETEKLIQSGHDVREGFKVVRELRNVAKTGVDPIRPVLEENSFWGTAERGAYGLAGSIAPMAATAVNPFLGALAYQATEYDRIMLENSDINPQFAQGLALVEGVANAAIDRVQLKSLSGKLPMFGRYLDRIKSDGIRRTVKIGANVVEQNLQEGAQDLIAPVLETAVAALREDMPDKDFSSLMEGWAGQRPETFFATLPLSLIGGGVASFRDIKHPSAELNATKLRMAGFSPEQTTFIQRAENPEEYDARIQMEFPNRTPENIQAGEELIQQSISEAQTPPENSAKLEETVAKDGTRMWTVTTPDGKELLTTKDQQAALVAIREHNGAQIINERNTVADMVDYFRAQDPTNEATIEAPRNVQQELDRLTESGDYKGIVNLSERIRFAGIPEDADLTSYNILGEANVETTAEGVFRGVIKLRENSRPEDAFEEINHVFVRKALAEGRTDLDSLRGWLNQTSEATGQTYATETETDIIENIAKVGMDFAAGRIDETSLPASFVDYIKRMLQVFKETMARALKLNDAFATGKIDANFESFLADSVGLNQQARVDTASQRVAGDVLADTDGKVVFSRAQAQTNAGEIRASNATITGPANYSIAAHHGTPHKVDKFSTAKIGTGEGAQAYGWGLYFAEEKKVATGYRDALSGVKLLDAKGEVLVGLTSNPVTQKILKEAQYFWKNGETTLPSIISEITQKKRQAEVWASSGSNVQSNTEFVSGSEEAIRLLQGGSSAKVDGNLYTVDLDVEPEDLLDWDKPLSEQGEKVKGALQSVSDNWLWQDAISGKGGERVGGALYSTLRATFPDAEFSRDGVDASKKASEALLAAGIPGIRYLDGSSRSEGIGTYNYVAFDENLIRITEENGNRIPASQALAAPSTGATNYSIGKKQSAGGIRFDEITKENPKHDGSRVGTAWQGKVRPTTQDTNDGIATINSKELEKQMAMLTHFVDGVPLPEFITKFQNPEERMRAFIDFQKENLLALYDAFDALSHDYVIRSTHWYDGARLLAEGIRDLYGLTIEQSSAVIAVFSPMKDWFQNVAMGQRFADVMANHKDTQISKATVGNAMSEMLTAAENESDLRKAFKKIKGRSISQLLADKTEEGRKVTAVAVRLMSTHVHGLTHDVLSPEGESLGIRKNLDGTNKKLVWQSYTFIEKAISIYEDGSAKNISKVLGTEHKIRNFYNNIVAPTSPYGDATVDTHAVNAAVLFPMGNKGYLVNLNFGGAGVAGGGNSGTYWLFHEALREAAAARKVMPRQMQSITWEAIRGLFTDVKKRDKNFVANIAKIWQSSQDANSARTQIIKLGITPPEWARVGSANSGIQGGVGKNVGQNANSAGSVQSGVRQGRKGGDGSGGVNYSIASQSEIDRVNKALGGMNRGPDERLKVYQRAKEKFSKLMAWNSDELAAMADTGSDESQIRRTQILQALGELDGILSVLPPEVRGRVGGYTKLAGIAPHDVLKDGVKVSEVSGMNGAIISAWMREGQNIGQAGKQVSLPPGYTATENLSTKRADKVIADFFRDRIKRMDTELEKVLVREYTEAITKVVKQSRPKAGDNGVRKSTLGAETQKFADTVLRATLLDDEATAKRMAEIEAALTMPDATAEDISALSEEWSILNTFGDLDNRSSDTLAQGLDWLKGQLQMGREAWRIKEQARIDEQRARNAATIEWLGKGTAKKRFADKGLMQRIGETANNYLLDHGSFEQFVSAFLPQEIASNFSERLRKADMAAQSAEIREGKGIIDAVRAGAKIANMSAGDAMLWLKSDQKNAVSYLEGRKVKDERIAIDLAQKIVTGEADRSKLTDSDVETLRNELAALPADTQKEFVTIKRVIFRGEDVKLDMSRAKAMQLLLSWNQPDVQIKMRKEGWTDDSAADLNALVNDPVSREVMAYAKELYGKGAGIVNPVYSRMFGMNMPQVKNYAPTRFINAKDTKDIGIDGSPSATGTTPSFAKTRVTHSAKIAPEDALTVMQGHIAQQAHWVHFAELAREFRAILSNPEVRESLKQTHGDGVLKSAELWADQLEQRGGNKAKEIAWFNPILGTVLSGKAVSSLGFNLKTLAMQLDNTVRFGLALDMRQIVSALSNPSTIVEDIQTVWESDALQNRLQGGATAEARFLFSRYAGKPNFAAKIAEASMTPINWLDSAGTSISSAIVYRANLNDALAAGMPEALAKQTALDAASQAIYRFAQPVSFGQKSIVENNANVMGKMFFLFMSDARLKTAILADAARGLATGSGDKGTHMRRILAIETMAVLSHVVSSAFRDGLSDDDDDEIWNLGGFAKAMLLAPLQGYFFAGTLGELAISKLTGQKTFNSTTQNPLLSAMEQAARAGNNLEDALNLDDPDAMTKEWNNIFRSMALSPAMAAPAVLLNMVKPVMGLYENATTED
jgi:hypothetical protein